MIALVNTLYYALEIYKWIVILSAVFSWLLAFNVINYSNQFVQTVSDALYRMTEPALRPIRNFLPNLGGIDISPIILLLVIFFLQELIRTSIAPMFY